MTYVQADKWDEHFTSEERERIEVLWDGEEEEGAEARMRMGGADEVEG